VCTHPMFHMHGVFLMLMTTLQGKTDLCFSFISGTGVLTQGLVLGRLYHLRHTPSPFCFSLLFSEDCLLVPQLAIDYDPPISTFQVTGIKDMYYHAHLVNLFS
jgi:hypothetical protein